MGLFDRFRDENKIKYKRVRKEIQEKALTLVTGLDPFEEAKKIKKSFKLAAVRVAGDLTMSVNKVAVCTGSGSSLIRNFFDSGSQVYISGDFRYHEAKEILAANLGLIDIGHFASEHLIIEVLAERLTSILTDTGLVVTVDAYRLEKDPFVIL